MQFNTILVKTAKKTNTPIQPAPITQNTKNGWCPLKFHVVYCEIPGELSDKPKIRKQIN